jgi:hypothetical protein
MVFFAGLQCHIQYVSTNIHSFVNTKVHWSGNYCPFAACKVEHLTKSGKEKLAHLLLHTLYSHQQR